MRELPKSTPVTLVRAWERDLATFIAIEKRSSLQTSKIFFATTIEEEAQKFFRESIVHFIKKSGRLVGIIAYEKKSLTHVHISEVVVVPAFRRQGIASEALQLVLKEWKFFQRVDLVTHPENPARKIYARLGFTLEKVVQNYYGDGEPRIVMVWENRHMVR